jgi:hypothetical protein
MIFVWLPMNIEKNRIVEGLNRYNVASAGRGFIKIVSDSTIQRFNDSRFQP